MKIQKKLKILEKSLKFRKSITFKMQLFFNLIFLPDQKLINQSYVQFNLWNNKRINF